MVEEKEMMTVVDMMLLSLWKKLPRTMTIYFLEWHSSWKWRLWLLLLSMVIMEPWCLLREMVLDCNHHRIQVVAVVVVVVAVVVVR